MRNGLDWAWIVASIAGCGGGAAAAPGSNEVFDGGATINVNTIASGDSGLPCDVQAILQAKCVGCHSSPPIGGAPMPLLTYADLTGPAPNQPSMTVIQVTLTRLQSTTAPMPPAGFPQATAQEIATLQAWSGAGEPQGSCGALDGGGLPYATPVQCSSQVTTNLREGSRMRPGDTCVTCHLQSGDAPQFTIAGTVYKTAHEPTNCNGVSVSGATVVITDSANNTLSLTVNSAGNFYTTRHVAMPFHAKVVLGGNERAMSAAQMNGDCNACHTENGAMSAPGRIMLP